MKIIDIILCFVFLALFAWGPPHLHCAVHNVTHEPEMTCWIGYDKGYNK
jgi:hypothetical protein